MPQSLKDKVVLITGASSGFGADAARLFAKEGSIVVLAARRVDRLTALAEEIRADGGQAFVVPLDVAELSQIDEAVQTVLDNFGQIDILFNNAGFGRLDWLERLDPVADIETQIAVNLTGLIQLTRLVLPSMMNRRAGTIINMSSVAGWIAPPLYSIYAATKHGVRGFTDALRREVAPFGIKVCGIYPGGATTEFGHHTGSAPSKSVFKAAAFLNVTSEFVARRTVGLARHPRRTLILPWWYAPVIWFERAFPGLVDWFLEVTFVKRFHKPDHGE
ncbi:MAG: short chain dehydrogenase/reductase family oxidoreductase [Anaerolineaceae bacterium]|nr:MAG: short chain dehydrogenase/reductase family oxidoreductase [Anaerolineaceae bacterium]